MERLYSRLVGAGYDEELMFATEQSDLLNMYAEYMLTPRPADPAHPKPGDEVRLCEIALKELELQLAAEIQQQRTEMDMRATELRLQAQRADEDLAIRRQDHVRIRERDACC